jgi:hypothetical protein
MSYRNKTSATKKQFASQKKPFRFPFSKDYTKKADVKTVAEAVALAINKYGHVDSPVVFTSKAIESAEKSTFFRPQEVVRHFDVLYLYALKLSSSPSLGKSHRDWFMVNGLTQYRNDISPTTKGKHGHEYKFTHDGRDYSGHRHFTLGSGTTSTCISIHFEVAEINGTVRVLVGHCGKHLSIASY